MVKESPRVVVITGESIYYVIYLSVTLKILVSEFGLKMMKVNLYLNQTSKACTREIFIVWIGMLGVFCLAQEITN